MTDSKGCPYRRKVSHGDRLLCSSKLKEPSLLKEPQSRRQKDSWSRLRRWGSIREANIDSSEFDPKLINLIRNEHALDGISAETNRSRIDAEGRYPL